MSTLAAKEEIVSCATCAQTRANGYSQRRLAVDVRADDFSRDDQFPFFCCDANGQTNYKQGGKKEAKLKGKNRKKWPEKTKRRVKGGCLSFPHKKKDLFCVNNTRRELFLFLIIHTYNSVVWHMTTTHTRRALLHYYFLSASLRTRDALFQLFPIHRHRFTQDVNRAS